MPSICRVITASVLFFGISLILPFTLSLVSAIPINYAVGWIGNTKRDADFYEVHYKQLKQKLEQQKTFNVDTCTETELQHDVMNCDLAKQMNNSPSHFL